ncbi:MAG TPA: hypothetical protein VNG95_05500 [Gemmatimonadales bacterium]|nr:hypothetical protein [Gemmatimonadales bacterium]
MFRQILYTQWKWSRLVLLLLVFAAFATPIFSIRSLGDPGIQGWDVRTALLDVEGWGFIYPFLAVGAALLLSLTTWGPDHAGKHVYALSLPVPRWHYALLRFAAGLVLLSAVVFAIWLGALVATATVSLPPGLHPYPHALALRFALAGVVAYSVFFAISAGTNRIAGYVLGAIGVLIALQIIAGIAGVTTSILPTVVGALFVWPGAFEIFTGRWMLIDV